MHVVERTYDFAAIIAERVRIRRHVAVAITRRTAPNRNKINALTQFANAVAEKRSSVGDIKDAYEVAYKIVVRDIDNQDKSDDEHRHLAEVARHMQSIVHGRLQCERTRVSQERAARPIDRYYECERVQRLRAIHRDLEAISLQYERINELMRGQMSMIDSIERNVASINVRIDASREELEDAAPRVYNKLHYNVLGAIVPRTFSGKLRFGVAGFALFYCTLFVLGLI